MFTYPLRPCLHSSEASVTASYGMDGGDPPSEYKQPSYPQVVPRFGEVFLPQMASWVLNHFCLQPLLMILSFKAVFGFYLNFPE